MDGDDDDSVISLSSPHSRYGHHESDATGSQSRDGMLSDSSDLPGSQASSSHEGSTSCLPRSRVLALVQSHNPRVTFKAIVGKRMRDKPDLYVEFVDVMVDGKATQFMKCQRGQCGSLVSRCSGSSALRHVNTAGRCKGKHAKSQPTITQFTAKGKPLKAAATTVNMRKEIRTAIAKYFLEASLPLVKVETPAFTNLLMVISKLTAEAGLPLELEQIVPSRKSLRADTRSLSTELENELRRFLTKAQSLTLSCDHWWDSANKNSFFGVVALASFDDKSLPPEQRFVKVALSLKVASSHKAIDIASDFNEVITRFGIEDKIGFIVTDGAPQNRSAFVDKLQLVASQLEECDDASSLPNEEGDEPTLDESDDEAADVADIPLMSLEGRSQLTHRWWIWCAAHQMQLAASHAERKQNGSKIVELLKKSRDVVSSLRKRHIAQLLDVSLKQFTKIRWDSQLALIESLLANKDPLEKIASTLMNCNDKDRAIARVIREISDDQSRMKQYVSLMSTFQEYRLRLSGDKHPTLGLVLPAKSKLVTLLDSAAEDADCEADIRDLAAQLKAEVQARLEITHYHVMATLLNPLFDAHEVRQMMETESIDVYKDAMARLELMYQMHIKESRETSTAHQQHFFAPLNKAKTQQNELQRFFATAKDANEPGDVMAWFDRNEGLFPVITPIARTFFAPATSVSSERLFSTCGYLLSKRRYRLLPSALETEALFAANAELIRNGTLKVGVDV